MSNSTSHPHIFELASEADTEGFGTRLANQLQPGDVIALIGPLGAGKTRLTKAVAQGLGVPQELVNSPTFTLIQEYSGRLPIRHCDAYRLKNPAEFGELGLEELFGAEGLRLSSDGPTTCWTIFRQIALEIRLEPISLTARRVTLTASGARSTVLLKTL
ncbi:MAG: tRNA (adenosine(37)-N6)-threonylcarbamoyltransferase complex ATPase subunit type 1 TsaE [Planctomycetaceae bacterium]